MRGRSCLSLLIFPVITVTVAQMNINIGKHSQCGIYIALSIHVIATSVSAALNALNSFTLLGILLLFMLADYHYI
jgi:hypothetical protein